MLWVKLLVLGLLLAAMVSLGRALFGLVKGDRQRLTMRSLAWRAGLSAAALLLLVVSKLMGWIEPHDVNPYYRDGQLIEQPEAPQQQGEAESEPQQDRRPQRRPIDQLGY